MSSEDKVNILVVDDLPEKLLVMETILAGLGQNVVTARSGREALRRLLELEFAVILLDVNMPEMDGFETAQMIRSRRQTADTPILFVTAFSDEMNTAQGYSLGAVDYILTPVVPEILRTKVGVFVDLHRKTQLVRRQAEERVELARAQAARAVAEENTRRSQFLAEVSKALVGSLEPETTLPALALQLVPFLADLAAVTLLDGHGHPWRTELAWAGPDAGQVLRRSWDGLPTGLALADALRRVLESGAPESCSDDVPMPSTPAGSAPERPDAPEPDLALRSALVLPLQARGRTLGALALALGPSGRLYREADRDLAGDLAGRAAIAFDNAWLYRNIQEADRRKNEFLAMLAHELRNPLAPIRNAVQVLGMLDIDNADLHWARDVIGRQVEHLVRLVDDLLDISRITGGKVQLRKEPVDVATAVARAVETSRPLIEARKHELSVTLPPEPVMVHADPIRLAQVLGNLLNNAAKYTEEGGRIDLAAGREGDEVVVRVRDTGIGISSEMLHSIFDLFTQAETSLDRSQGGLGIGLTLVHRLVEMHGGTVRARSEGPDRGSEFLIRLPALTGPVPARRAPDPGAAPAAAAPHRILLVDDHPDVARSLARLLRLKGYEVRTANTGPLALEAVADFRPEVVLLDIGLPGMDGYQVARAIRERPDAESIILVALTGYGQEEYRRRSREAGFDHHLVKPVSFDALSALFAQLPDRVATSGPGPTAPFLVRS